MTCLRYVLFTHSCRASAKVLYFKKSGIRNGSE